jgi:hypothetical protein
MRPTIINRRVVFGLTHCTIAVHIEMRVHVKVDPSCQYDTTHVERCKSLAGLNSHCVKPIGAGCTLALPVKDVFSLLLEGAEEGEHLQFLQTRLMRILVERVARILPDPRLRLSHLSHNWRSVALTYQSYYFTKSQLPTITFSLKAELG